MDGHIFIVPGDITRLAADAIAYSTSTMLSVNGSLYSSFEARLPSFAAGYQALRSNFRGRCSPGDAFWLPLETPARPTGVVVVVATGGDRTEEDKAGIAVRAAIDKAVESLRGEGGRTDRLLIALPAFRVGMGGDRRHRLRSALAQVTAAREALARHSQVDVAFLTYIPALYPIFLEARRQALGPCESSVTPPVALTQAILAGECVLFVGAGLSRGAGLPDWSELVGRLAQALGLRSDARVDYLDLAQWYRERFGTTALAQLLSETFADPANAPLPTLAHYLLLSLPIRLVMTTNYDDLLEQALVALKRYPVKVVEQKEVPRTGKNEGVYVIKLHGDAADCTGIVLSRDDYDEFFERRPAMALLLEGLLLNRTFFFVGYGLRDPNFRQLYSRIARMLQEARRPAFATTFEAAGEGREYFVKQWQHKQLQLISLAAQSSDDQQQHLLRFLDRLAECVAVQRPGPFLAPDVEVPEPLISLRAALSRVGSELEAGIEATPSGMVGQAALLPLVQVLEFLTAHGWRPGTGEGDLSNLWEELAAKTEEPALRRRLLLGALEHAEAFAAAQRVREQLARLDGET